MVDTNEKARSDLDRKARVEYIKAKAQNEIEKSVEKVKAVSPKKSPYKSPTRSPYH